MPGPESSALPCPPSINPADSARSCHLAPFTGHRACGSRPALRGCSSDVALVNVKHTPTSLTLLGTTARLDTSFCFVHEYLLKIKQNREIQKRMYLVVYLE